VAFSPDGQTLASASFSVGISGVAIWRVSDGTQLRLIPHGPPIHAVVYSLSSEFVAAAGTELNLWRPADGSLLRKLTNHTGSVNAMATTSDGQIVASGSVDGTIKLWRAEDGQLLRTLTGHTSFFRQFHGIFSQRSTPSVRWQRCDNKDLASIRWRASADNQ
jgi:WD40 repeat protein